MQRFEELIGMAQNVVITGAFTNVARRIGSVLQDSHVLGSKSTLTSARMSTPKTVESTKF